MKHTLKLTIALLLLWIVKPIIGQNILITDSTICFDKWTGSQIMIEHKKGIVFKSMYESCLDSNLILKDKLSDIETERAEVNRYIQKKDYDIERQKNKNLRKTVFIIAENAAIIISLLIFL